MRPDCRSHWIGQRLLAYRTADYIAEHFVEPITQSDVAEVLGVTLAYLSSIFHEAKGGPVRNFSPACA